MPPRINLPAVLPTEAEPRHPHPAHARADRLPGRRRPSSRQGRGLPGPGFLCHRQRHPERDRGSRALDLRRAALKPLGQGLRPRPHGLRAAHAGPGGRSVACHGRPREVLQARSLGSRHEVRHGSTAALGPSRHLPPACRQGPHRVGDGPGYRRRQGPGRPEELDAVFDRAPSHFAFGGDPDRDLAGDSRSGADERLLHHRLPGLGGGRSLCRAP